MLLLSGLLPRKLHFFMAVSPGLLGMYKNYPRGRFERRLIQIQNIFELRLLGQTGKIRCTSIISIASGSRIEGMTKDSVMRYGVSLALISVAFADVTMAGALYLANSNVNLLERTY